MKLSLFTEAVHVMRLNPNNLSIACSISVGSDNTARSIQCLNRDLTKLRRRRQGESQKNNRPNERNNNSARASRFFAHFFAVPAQQRREIATLLV